MTRRRRFIFTIAFLFITITILIFRTPSHMPRPGMQPRLQETIKSAVAEPTEFIKSHVTGGVGVMLMMGQAGQVEINGVLPGSPAAEAGLRRGDVVMSINQIPTAGQPLEKVVESIRGFTMGKVTVKVKRDAGASEPQEMTFEIHRSSWNNLGITNSTSSSALILTNSAPLISTSTNRP